MYNDDALRLDAKLFNNRNNFNSKNNVQTVVFTKSKKRNLDKNRTAFCKYI